MMILKGLLLFVEFATCVLLICVVLLQKSKSGGGLGAIGGGMGEAIFGAQMGNVLTRTTVILAIIFLVNTTVLALLGSRGSAVPRVGSGSAPAATQPVDMLPPVEPGSAAAGVGLEPAAIPVEMPVAPDAGGVMPEPIVIPETAPPAPAN